jgi:FkbM family methyltransferase
MIHGPARGRGRSLGRRAGQHSLVGRSVLGLRVALALARLAPSPPSALRNALVVASVALLRTVLQRTGRCLPVEVEFDGWSQRFAVDCAGDVLVLWEVWALKVYDVPPLEHASAIVDAGANIGAAASFFKARRPQCLVHAFEPDPRTFRKLVRNVGGVPGIVLHREAISDQDGTGTFYSSRDSWDSSLMPTAASLMPATPNTVVVQCRRLQTVRREAHLDAVDLLKLDIEGGEFAVLLAPAGLDGVRAIVGELHFDLTPEHQPAEIIEACRAFRVALSGDPHGRMVLVAERLEPVT